MRQDVRDVFGLDGRVCVITGAGSGIGRAIALALANDGARVAVLDRDEAGALETLSQVERAGGEGFAAVCDVTSGDSIEQARLKVRDRFGDADILVNNAGIIRPGALETLSIDDWNLLIDVNLTGYFRCAQAFAKPMLAKRKGTLVHVSSIASICATPIAGSYSVAKAGVSMLSQLLALEWGPQGIRSNAVLPGMIVTPMVEAVWNTPGTTESRSAVVPSRRPGYPDDIAQAVLFLASDRASYINGTEVLVDGGFSKTTMNFVPRPGFEASKNGNPEDRP